MMPNPRIFIAALFLLLAVAAGLLGFGYYRMQKPGEAYGAPFTLTDMNGGEITEQAFRGHPSAVFFGFTHCPEVCPTTLYELDGWFKELGEDGKDIRAFFVSVDPERDTPELLKTYITNVTDRVTGITGDPAKVEDMIKAFRIYARKVPTEGGDYTMDHTASIILLDSAGSFHGTIAWGENGENAIGKLKRLAGS